MKNWIDMDDIDKAGLNNTRKDIEIFSQKTGVSIRRAIDIYWALNPINLAELADKLSKTGLSQNS